MDKKMKCGILLLIAIVLIAGIAFLVKRTETDETDAKKFASEYANVDDDNPFVYRTADEVIKIMEHGTGVVYLGYPECPWCQAYVEYLNDVAKEVGIDKIYYCNTKELKESSMDKYYEIVELLHGNLQYTDEGDEWIYVPNVSFHVEGRLVANDYETSKDTHGLTDPKEYWTQEEISDLKERLKQYMEEVKDALGICTDCNK